MGANLAKLRKKSIGFNGVSRKMTKKENMGQDVRKLKTQCLIIGKEASGEKNSCCCTCRRVEDIRIEPGETERLLC